ncbi:Dam family site-specific DNA-(adenine-N6)-methyltransferase [Phormidium sp. CLA17]|uniref:DNA adenine methylase n=1 Tax=Leptolyngbya sp. Cla-17 TaxID=2803751 RepID=UPI001491F346|nr:Dam family site-specific DNA-(adenine-N6)-methyltransferase [Leptolyngbya sp. Cla-17]MBM0743181.1 Dam family site-specific DNA-(adenine-N6)-methyltransferase [Leptolyngbya sp. Cla-17]
MSSVSLQLPRIGVPPIKCQGIKTKLVPFILSQVVWQETSDATWIEPFLGSGVVAFNRIPHRAILADTNPHIIGFYQAIQQGTIDRAVVQEFLTKEGEILRQRGAEYYYEVRDRFNQTASPLDFLFLNRACFNGLMRFNSEGKFNVPFCQKTQRFSQSYITKISNQVDWVAQRMVGKVWKFRVADWQETLKDAKSDDYVYLDPPYIGRHADYHNSWNLEKSEHLAAIAQRLPCKFAVSMWLENRHRQNNHIRQCWPPKKQVPQLDYQKLDRPQA